MIKKLKRLEVILFITGIVLLFGSDWFTILIHRLTGPSEKRTTTSPGSEIELFVIFGGILIISSGVLAIYNIVKGMKTKAIK